MCADFTTTFSSGSGRCDPDDVGDNLGDNLGGDVVVGGASGDEGDDADTREAEPEPERQAARFQAVELVRRGALRKIVDNWHCLPVPACTREKMDATWTDAAGRFMKSSQVVMKERRSCCTVATPQASCVSAKYGKAWHLRVGAYAQMEFW